ncbi:hypothetical protein SODG_007446 [Sodalis praecaptivus]
MSCRWILNKLCGGVGGIRRALRDNALFAAIVGLTQ